MPTMAIMAISVAASQRRCGPESRARYDMNDCFLGQRLTAFDFVARGGADAKGTGEVTGISHGILSKFRRRLSLGLLSSSVFGAR